MAIAGASASANLIGKRLFPRRRPAAEEVPIRRRLIKRPTSSSFPSGHSASAAAFATAVAMEAPSAGVFVGGLAALVAYSRVHTGVHWPSDAGAGALIGAGAAMATRHWWPLHPDVPAHTAHRAQAPVIRDGDDMLVVVNPASGDAAFDPIESCRKAWPAAHFVYPERDTDLRAQLQREIDARDGRVHALGVAGGDGSGSRRWFVNTASLGAYPEMVRLREFLERKHPKWPAAAIATARVLRRARPLHVELNGKRRAVWILFVGNGTYSPTTGIAPPRRPALDTGALDVRYIRADVPFSRARFLLGAVTNSLHASHVYRHHNLPVLDVRLLGGHRRIATDGEVGPLGNRFCFYSRPSALTIYRP